MLPILSPAASVVLKGADYLAGPVGRHCGYMFFTDRKVRQLDDELKELDHTRRRVRHDVEAAQNNMKPIESDVEKWLKDEQIVANIARSVLDYNGRAQKSCFYGWLPDPKARYCLGKDASKIVKEIQKLFAQKNTWEKVYHENDPPALVHGALESPPPSLVGGAADLNSSATDGGDNITHSRASIFKDIMEALGDDKLKVIGVYGPGGVGKTTLLKEVEQKLKKGRQFDMIIKAEVSQTPDLDNIRDQIADYLNLNLTQKQSAQGRRDLLLGRLKEDSNKKILIILDNVLVGLDLTEIGIPLGEESKGWKLLLTSRYNNVLLEKMRADQTFHLQGLEDEEAVRLFEKTVGDWLQDEEELKKIATQVAKKLVGLPLLIKSVATALKNSDVGAWRSMSENVDANEMETIVQPAYEHLKGDETKSLFLLCGLIGGTIQVETLLVLGMGLGLFEKYKRTMQGARDRLDTMLSELRSACLLLDGGDNKENVTIHDLYSEVVVSTPFRDQNFLIIHDDRGTWPKEKLDECRACLVNDGNDRLVELMPRRFPHAKILMLLGKNDMGDYSKKYFKDMKELRALCLCSRSITSLLSPTENLGNLQSLIINCRLKDVAILGNLTALQILSFAEYTIRRLPKKIGELTNLRSLNIGHTDGLIIEPGVLEGLINLEELHVKGSYHRWMKEDDLSSSLSGARLAELKSLTKLTSLEISISPRPHLLEDDDLPIWNLIRFSIEIGNYERRYFQGLNSMKLDLRECGNVLSREWIQVILQKTQYLYLSWLSEFKESAHELCTQGFRELKHLHIENSSSIKYIANSSSDLGLTAFTKLESLFLRNLSNLEKICHGAIDPACFSILKYVSIENCNRLKYLWCLSEIQGLAQLEEIRVWGCESMRALIRDDTGEGIADADRIAELPNVRRLDLGWFSKLKAVRIKDCDRLKYLWHLSEIQRLAQLEEIEVWGCKSMRALIRDDTGEGIADADRIAELPNVRRLRLIGLPNMTSFLCAETETPSEGTPIQISFPRLESLRMTDFRSAPSILKSDWIPTLANLESLDIWSCETAEVVFDLGELQVARDVKIFSRLTKMSLSRLFNLQRIWKHDVQLHEISRFQNLQELFVSHTGLPFLFPMSVAKCLRQIRDIQLRECYDMRAVIVDEEGRDEGTNDIVEFPLLRRLRISGCPIEKFFSCTHGKKESVTPTLDSQDAYSDSFFNRKVSLPCLEELKLESAGPFKKIWHDELPRSSFYKLATLILGGCSDVLNVFPSTIIGRLHNLERVSVSECPSLESMFDCGSLDSNMERKNVSIPKLEEVWVTRARRLRHMVKSDSQTVLGFPSLNRVYVSKCSELRYLFPNSMATTLAKLKEIFISRCEQMEEVVLKDEGGRSKATVISFPSLIRLCIRKCRNFGAFIPSPTSVKVPLSETDKEDDGSPQPMFNEMIQLPNITNLQIEGAQCKELWSNQIPSDSFCKLEILLLEHCDNLQRIAPSHMWKRMQHRLDILRVESCRSIEIIYEGDETVTKSGKLRRLVLRDLENLRHIWQFNGLLNIPFPNLRFIEFQSCPRLRMLFPTFTGEFLGQIKELVVESCEDLELVAGHEEREEATGTRIIFSELTALRLFELPKFRSILPAKYSAEFPSLQVLSRVSCGREPDQGLGDWESHRRGREIEIYRETRKYR